MDNQTLNDYIFEALSLGLPSIQNKSKIQRTVMSATKLSQDATSIISEYYFPIDIDAVFGLAKVDHRLYQLMMMLACGLGIWPIIRMATKKKKIHLLKFNLEDYTSILMSSAGEAYSSDENAFIQTLANIAYSRGYRHIAELLLNKGADISLSLPYIIYVGCDRSFEKAMRLDPEFRALAINFRTLCESKVKIRNEGHIRILRWFISNNVEITKKHMTLAEISTVAFPEHPNNKRFLEIIKRRLPW